MFYTKVVLLSEAKHLAGRYRVPRYLHLCPSRCFAIATNETRLQV